MDTTSALEDKVALVTGAARGIDAHTARTLARRNVRLVLVDRDTEPLQELASELGSQIAVAAVADVRDLQALEKAVAAGVNRFGGIDLVLANAEMGCYGSVAHIDPTTFARVIEVNLIGVFHTVRAALPTLVDRRGYVLIVSSMAAFLPGPGLSAYAASKAGVEHFASSLRLELMPQGIDVGSAHMTWIDTPLLRDAHADLPAFADMLATLPGPLRKTLPVEVCADAFVEALATRKRRVYVPKWAMALAWLKPVLTMPLVERVNAKRSGLESGSESFLEAVNRQVAELGRSTSARTVPAPLAG